MFSDLWRSMYNRTLGWRNKDEFHENNSSQRILLGQYFSRLRDVDQCVKNYQINLFENEIKQIGQNLFELSDKLSQIQCQTNSIDDNTNILKFQQHMIENEPQIIEIKQSIGEYFRNLTEKLNLLSSSNIDDQLVPVLGSTLNQLITAVRRIEVTINNNNKSLPLNIGTHCQYLTEKFNNQLICSNEDNNEINIQLACYSQILDSKLNELKTIFYKRYKTKFQELIETIKLKYETDFNNYRKMNNLKLFELKEFVQYCVRSNKDLHRIRVVFHEKLKNDLEFKHYFKRFLITYKKNLFELLLIKSIHFIPKSKLYLQASSNDEKYDLFQDIEQLEFIFNFLIKIIDLNEMKDFQNFVTNETSIFDLFMKNIQNSNDYLILLKESYLVFVRDHILTLYDRNDNNTTNDIQLKIDQIRQFNDENLKSIHDSERQMKKRFIQQYRGENWNEKLIINVADINDDKMIEFSMEQDIKSDQLKDEWLSTNDMDFYSEYEKYILNMKDSLIKSRHLFEISQIYNDKQPRLNVYLKKSIEFLNKSIAIDEFRINSDNYDLTVISTLRMNLRLKYELKALIYLHMAGRYDFVCFDKFNSFNMATFYFLQFDRLAINESNVQYHENNFIQLFKNAFESNNDSSINIYDRILTINPYFFQAQYQKLLKFYELNDCSKICHIHPHFSQLIKSDSSLLDLFQILINKKKTKRKSKLNKSSDFLNKILKIKINNNQHTPLYLKLIQTEYSYQLKCSNEEQLINLIKYGKLNMNQIKDNNNNKSLKLKYQLLNFDLKQIINNLNKKIENQEMNFLYLIHMYKKLELTNEIQYKNLNKTFLKLLPVTRLNFIRINSNYFQKLCEISRAIQEFQSFHNDDDDVNKQILQLKFERVDIYRKNYFFYLEELELLEILNNQKKNSDHNPIIYYRLAYLNKQRANVRIAMNYINLAKKKYYEKINKPIFRKINHLKAELSLLENRELDFMEKNQLNLIQIWNLIMKFKLQSKLSILNGFELFTSTSNRISLIDCLFYHLIEDTNDIEQFLSNNPDHPLTRKFNDSQEILGKNPHTRKELIDKFNKTFKTKFQCLFLDENINSFDCNRIPIILFQDKKTNRYQTIKQINYYMFLTNLITTYDAKKDLKMVCSKFLNEEIGKNILIDNKENKNIERFIKSTIDCEDMKMFSERVVYYLKTNEYEENCFYFWSSIADFQYHIDVQDTLNYFKKLFRLAIEEHREEENEKHKSALQLIDDLIEQNQSQQKPLTLFNRLKEKILQALGRYENISSKSTIRKKINEIISSNYDLVDKLQKLIAKDCLNIDLEFENPEDEIQLYEYLKEKNQSELVYKIFLVIEETLAKPKIKSNEKIAVIDSYNIILSELVNDLEKNLKESNIEEVKFYGTNIFIDYSLNSDYWHGINLVFASDTIHFVQDSSENKITLDVSGKPGQDGQHAEHRQHATRSSEDGLDGLPGRNGEAGQNGGHIYLIARSRFDGKLNIEKLITSGGEGGQGGNGGNAGNGANGKDGKNADEDRLPPVIRGFSMCYGEAGTRGGNGGAGGDAGLAGFGGHAGLVHIEENQIVINDGFISLIESIDKSNIHAEDGLPGQGGKSGIGGLNGLDYLHYRPVPFGSAKEYRESINFRGYKNTLFKLYVYFTCGKQMRKPNGIGNGVGKTANTQLKSGKNRNKHKNKNQLNEEQMKSEANQIINHNNEESKNLSQNVSKSMNLLKDQMTDILDERQLKMKTHQLSDSMLDNAHKIAQEALALNAIKLKTKMENTILKTSENDSDNKHNKVSIQIKLKFDHSEQEIIKFQKLNIISDLQNKYQKKIKHFHIHLTEDVKTIKHEIKSLKSTGKNIFFQIDIDNLNNIPLSLKHNENQFDLMNFFLNESNSNSLFNRSLSSLINSFRSLFYDPVTKEHKPFLLKQYFQQLNNLKRQKRKLIQMKNQLNQLNIEQFIQNLSLQFGNQETIKKKLSKFDEIFASQHDLVDIDDFIKQIYTSDDSQPTLSSNTTTDPIFVQDISKFLLESNISKKRIDEFLSILSTTIEVKPKFKQPELNQCSPIYHKYNEQQIIEIHPIEELINEFLYSKEKNLQLIIQIFNSFLSIIETNQENLFCQKKLEKFLHFLFINLIYIPNNFEHGHLFLAMRRILNSIQLNYSTSFFNHLELILLIKEKQFNDFQKYLNRVQSFFQHKQIKFDLEMRILNYIQNNRKSDIFDLFKKYCRSITNDINQNKNIEEFIDNLYLKDDFKNQIRILFVNFHNYLTKIKDYEYSYLTTHKKIFLEKINLFLKEQKRKIKANFNDLLFNQQRSQNIIHQLYANCNLQTNLRYLNDINISTQLSINQFIQNLKVLYDQLRFDEISRIPKKDQLKSDSIHADYNKNVCQILFITRQMENSDRIKVKNGYHIIVFKQQASQFQIYFRDKNDHELQNRMLNHSNLIEQLNNFIFNGEILLSKEENKQIYKIIYEQVTLNHGFTKYTAEQIESFEKFKEMLQEKLLQLNKYLPNNFKEYTTNEINLILDFDLPEFWSLRIFLIWNNIQTILKIKDKFPNEFILTSTESFHQFNLTTSDVCQTLNKNIENLLSENKQNVFIDFYRCLSIFDYLVLKILDDDLHNSIDDISKDLSIDLEKKTDLEKIMLYEITLKNNQFLQTYFFSQLTKIFDRRKEEIVNSIDSLSCEINIKHDLQQRTRSSFIDLISNHCIQLFNLIDQFYLQSFNQLSIIRRCQLYKELMVLINEFNENKIFDWNQKDKLNDNLNDFMETSYLFIQYLEKYSLILISGVMNIDYHANVDDIKKILNELKYDSINNKLFSFDEHIFIKFFFNRIMNNINEMSIDIVKEYLYSFEIILKNSSLSCEVLILFDEYYRHRFEQIDNVELKQLLEQFGFLITDQYKNLIKKIKIDFVCLMLNVKQKNRILNVIWKYLTNNCQDKNLQSIKLEKNQLNQISIRIQTIFECNQFEIKDLVDCYQNLNDSLLKRSLICLQTFEDQLKILQFKSRIFVQNIDFIKNCPMKNLFIMFNDYLSQHQTIKHELILDLLENVFQHRESFNPLHYESTMKKILLNLQMDHEEFDLEFLSTIEIKMKTNEKSPSIKKDYLNWIIEQIETEAMARYNQDLKKYEEKRKNLNTLIQEIIDLFWSNISMSDLLNKEREKIYLHLNIEKLLKLSTENPQEILNQLLIEIKQLQINPNKKQFTNEIHQYMNQKINENLLDKIIVPVKLTPETKNNVKDILNANYQNTNNELILNEFSLLFEASIDQFKPKAVFNEFFVSCTKIFKYFSWRLCEYQSKSKQEIIDKAIERLNSSLKKFKMKLNHLSIEKSREVYKDFYQFEKFYYLRTHDNQLQQELNELQSQNQIELTSIDQIREYWTRKLQQSMFKTDQSIIELAKDIFQSINEKLFTEKFKFNEETKLRRENDSQTFKQSLPDLTEEEKANIKINFEDKIRALKQISMNIIEEEGNWKKKKKLIQYFERIKKNLIEEYFESIYEQQSDKTIDYKTFRNSNKTKNMQEILFQCDVGEWNQEIDYLKAHLFTIDLLKLYEFDFDILRQQYDLIEKLIQQKQDDDTIKIKWIIEVKDNHDLMDIVQFIQKYSKESSSIYDCQTSLDALTIQFIKNIKIINDIKISIDSLLFFTGVERFEQVIGVLQRKQSHSRKISLKKLSDFFYLVSNFDDFPSMLDLINNFPIEKWFLYLNVKKIQFDLNSLFNRYLDELDLNNLVVENLDGLDKLIETKYNEIAKQYQTSLKTITNTINSIELSRNIELKEKEIFFEFLQMKLSFELKKPADNFIHPNDLDKVFNKYLIDINILNKVIHSLNNQSMDFNDQLIIENIHLKSLNNLVPYLTRFWIIEQLELNRKVRESEVTTIIQYLELIKTSYSEEKMCQLIDLIKISCENESIIPRTVIDLLMNISNKDWLFDSDVIEIMKTTKMNKWEEQIENYMKEKRSKKRDFNELIHLMQQDKNNLNQSIKDYLNSSTILTDLQSLVDKLDQRLDKKIDKPVRKWNENDIRQWAKEIKGNQLLSNKEDVQNAITIVSQGIYLFTEKKFRLRETQIIALWLFLNPDLNKMNVGCLGQISTGEGKSVIVAALAAVQALSSHRVDIITSSNVLAIRDANEFRPFYKMLHLQVSNNCDSLCEQGDKQNSAEDIRKSRYCNNFGPIDIIYGECSCFERDILLTEFNKNDERQNIIGKRLTANSISSVIIDEVDSMLLDKAGMVLYLSHSIDTLRALERILISIWQTINQPIFDRINKALIDDDLIQFVSDVILEQIDNKKLEIPEYDSSNCDYINMKMFVKRRMSLWIRSAFHVKEMIPNDTYIITQDQSDKSSKSEVKITVMDKDTGTEQLSTRWSNGVHQFLQLKHMRRLTSESLKAVFISNMSFFKRYKHNIIGLTGSLGSNDEQNLLNKVYQLRFFELPRFKSELFRELNGSIHTEQNMWLEAIKNALDREIYLKSANRDRRRAVLIISENVKSVLILKEYLSNSYPNAKMYKSAYEKFEIDQMHPGDIIIATNLAGRGTDLDTSQKLEDNGGLHVITTYLPTNIRIEMQTFGRTARKGNKGTGEYIILSQCGLSISQLKQWRNFQEKERLDHFLTHDLPKIKIEEDLLQGFNDGELSCIGFVKLYQNIEDKLLLDSNRFYYGNEYVQFQLHSLKNRWAFWLDSMTEQINMINIIGSRKIIEQFHQFQSSIERDFNQNSFKRLIIEPAEFIKLGKFYRDGENWSKALECYNEATKDKFYSYANYYRSSCQQNINYGQGISSKREFKHNLIQTKSLIDKEMHFLHNAAQVAFEIDEKNRQLGFVNYGNEYDKQVKEKLAIWNIFSGTILNAIGCSIDSKDLTTVKYLCDVKKAEKLFKKLQKDKLIKPTRVSYKLKEQIELPSIFDNETTKKQMYHYLKGKSNERKKFDGHLNELNYEIFQKDLKKLKIFLPYFQEFIDLLQKNSFIKPIVTRQEDQLFVLEQFVEEKLTKVFFPNEISDLKENLFKCLKEMTNEKTFKGKKTEIFNEIQRLFKLKSEKDLNKHELNHFYKFLNENLLVKTIVQYSVIKEKILKKNENVKNDYFYANLYDFERHYTDEFNKFELIFRKNFLKITLFEQEFDQDTSYFTLKDTIDSNDFDLLKTQDEAIDYLWNYLKANSFIKPPSVNIGLIDFDEVKKKRDQIKKEVESFLKKELIGEQEKELKEAVQSVFNIIDQTIGDIKKLPNDKTIASYLEIKTNYFLNHRKHAPDTLDEFIELAFDVIFQLQEKKEPPKWYEIAVVIALGVVQIVAGVLAKIYIPYAGHLIGEFLISTGCDDILFGVRCAIVGDFSWEKYWEHKKQSMITSAITAVVFIGISFLKNAKKLESIRKAWNFQKLTGAKKLHTAAKALGTTANISKYVGKEIAKTLVQTGLSELASMGIDHMLDSISSIYERELTESIKKSINDNWNIVESEMKEIFRLLEGNAQALSIIDDCIHRKLENLPEAAFFKTFASRSGPVMQGLGRAMGTVQGGKGLLLRTFTSYAPALINLGVNIYEITEMISGFMKNLHNDLKSARKSLKKTNNQYVLTDLQTTEFETYQKSKIILISTNLSGTFNQKLKHGIIAPVLNFAANKLISKGIESVASTDRIEQLTNRFELIHAASNFDDKKAQYVDDLKIFIAEGRPIDLTVTAIDPKEIIPANNDGYTLQQAYDLHGTDMKTFLGKDGKIYIRRPSSKQYYRSIRRDKPAGLHEQKKISLILQCTVTNVETISNEQTCVLTRADGINVPFIIRDNLDGTKHAEIIVDGKPVSLESKTGNKNDCYYNVALVANEMSKGKPFEEAVKILDDKNNVQNLRNDVSLAMKNDDQSLKEFRWTNQTDFKAHFDSLIGIRQDPNTLRLELSDQDVQSIKQWINRDKRGRPKKFKNQTDVTENFDNAEVTVTHHHVIGLETIVDILKEDIKGLNDKEIKDRLENYLNAPGNERNKRFILNEMFETRMDSETRKDPVKREAFKEKNEILAEHNPGKDSTILRQSIVWNPNIVVGGPPGASRKFDPDSGGELKKYAKEFKDTAQDLLPTDDPKANELLNYEDKIGKLFSDQIQQVLEDNKTLITRIGQVLIDENENKAKRIIEGMKNGLSKIFRVQFYIELNQKVKELKEVNGSKEENLKKFQEITQELINKINITGDEKRFKDLIFKIDSELVLKNQRELIDSLGRTRNINILENLCNMDERNRGLLVWKKDDNDIFKRYIFEEQ